ncbi:hypothetical protein THF5G08_90198 [Vibrio jasicida]|nr:hypothetical protein THF5G08_90198 [Vibrio jasicida]
MPQLKEPSVVVQLVRLNLNNPLNIKVQDQKSEPRGSPFLYWIR